MGIKEKLIHCSAIILVSVLIILLALLCSCASSSNSNGGQGSNGGQVITIDYGDVIDYGPQLYGVEYEWLDQYRDLYLERYRELNGNLVRVQIHQDWFEPTNDNDDPSYSEIDFSRPILLDSQMGTTMSYEYMFKSLAAEFPDMHFMISITTCTKWNAADPDGYLGLGGKFPPLDYAEHREFIRALARLLVDECGIPPEQLSFSFVNEPNIKNFFVGTQADLVRMAEETRVALDQISPHIQMGGLDEVGGTSWTAKFYPQRPEGCCDMWTYHVYQLGLTSMWNALQQRAAILSQGGPVWVTEFADRTYGTPNGKMDFSSQEAALEFAVLLGRVWSEVDGITFFRLADTYIDAWQFSGWVGHGLFADHRGTHADGVAHKRFPSYWVFANFYKQMGGADIIASTGLEDLEVISGKRINQSGNYEVVIWVTNTGTTAYNLLRFQISNFPASYARMRVYDNLQSNISIDSLPIYGKPLNFTYNIPAESSYSFVLTSY